MSTASNPLEEIRGGLPRNFIRSCVLLLVAERPSHGYDLLERLVKLGVPSADPGGLYRTLRSMEKDGLLQSSWETSHAGPARRGYELTKEGEAWLHAWAGAHSETRRILTTFIERYEEAAIRILR